MPEPRLCKFPKYDETHFKKGAIHMTVLYQVWISTSATALTRWRAIKMVFLHPPSSDLQSISPLHADRSGRAI
jgi:hypothetical protein